MRSSSRSRSRPVKYVSPSPRLQTRLPANSCQASDLASTSRLIVTIVTLCKGKGEWGQLNEQVLLLSKKHGQLKQAITKMVQVVMGFLDETPNMETKMSIIETLRTVTEGKVGYHAAPSAIRR